MKLKNSGEIENFQCIGTSVKYRAFSGLWKIPAGRAGPGLHRKKTGPGRAGPGVGVGPGRARNLRPVEVSTA